MLSQNYRAFTVPCLGSCSWGRRRPCNKLRHRKNTMDDTRQGTREKCREWAANMALWGIVSELCRCLSPTCLNDDSSRLEPAWSLFRRELSLCEPWHQSINKHQQWLWLHQLSNSIYKHRVSIIHNDTVVHCYSAYKLSQFAYQGIKKIKLYDV